MTERLPDMQEVYQSNAADEDRGPIPVVPVSIDDPVRAQALPAQSWATAFFELSTGDAVRIARRDPRRKRAVINVAGQVVWIGPTQSIARKNVGFRIALTDGPIEITHSEEIYATGDVAGASVCVLAEYWTG